jgi:hypothetical protein
MPGIQGAVTKRGFSPKPFLFFGLKPGDWGHASNPGINAGAIQGNIYETSPPEVNEPALFGASDMSSAALRVQVLFCYINGVRNLVHSMPAF